MPAIFQPRCPKVPSRAPKVGTEVKLCGLLGRKHLNNLTGIVVPHLDGSLEDSTYRCRVQVHDSKQTGAQTVKVLARNLTLVTAASRWEIVDRIEVTEAPSEAHLALPTNIKLNIDKGFEVPVQEPPKAEFTNRICTSKGSQPLGETYAKYQASAAGRDPSRLRHNGLSFFKDCLDEEAHPGNNKVRATRAPDTWMNAMASGYDWRKDGGSRYVDPFHIPVEQGGHAAHVGLDAAMHKDAAEAHAGGEVPLHPRLRGLLLNEDLQPEDVYEPVERGYRELLLFTDEKDFMKTRDVGGPLRCAAHKEREFKKKETNRSKLLKGRPALSVKPAEDRILQASVEWSGREIDIPELAPDMPDAMMGPRSVDTLTQGAYESRHLVTGSPELHQQPPPQPKEIASLSLRMNTPSTENSINRILERSLKDAERGFNYGLDAGNASSSLPWYESKELASSMLILDPDARLPSATSGSATNGLDAGNASSSQPWYESKELASSMLLQDPDARLPSAMSGSTTNVGVVS